MDDAALLVSVLKKTLRFCKHYAKATYWYQPLWFSGRVADSNSVGSNPEDCESSSSIKSLELLEMREQFCYYYNAPVYVSMWRMCSRVSKSVDFF
jgi:hypothetical protein